jgi:hypothetical protein
MELDAFDQYIANIFVGKWTKDETRYRTALLDITY